MAVAVVSASSSTILLIGLLIVVAVAHVNPVAALPAAVFSVWHNVSGSLLASYWSRKGLPVNASPAVAVEPTRAAA